MLIKTRLLTNGAFSEVGGRIPPPLPGAEEGGGVRLQRSKFWLGAPPTDQKFRDTAKGLLIKVWISIIFKARNMSAAY